MEPTGDFIPRVPFDRRNGFDMTLDQLKPGERAIVTGDLAHFPAQVDRIEWCSSFDLDKTTNTETRRKLFQQLEANGAITAFCHFAEAPFGKLIRSEGKRIWQAIGFASVSELARRRSTSRSTDATTRAASTASIRT